MLQFISRINARRRGALIPGTLARVVRRWVHVDMLVLSVVKAYMMWRTTWWLSWYNLWWWSSAVCFSSKTDNRIIIKFNIWDFYERLRNSFNFHLHWKISATTLHKIRNTFFWGYLKYSKKNVAYTDLFSLLAWTWKINCIPFWFILINNHYSIIINYNWLWSEMTSCAFSSIFVLLLVTPYFSTTLARHSQWERNEWSDFSTYNLITITSFDFLF
jgi:hypothetical protein